MNALAATGNLTLAAIIVAGFLFLFFANVAAVKFVAWLTEREDERVRKEEAEATAQRNEVMRQKIDRVLNKGRPSFRVVERGSEPPQGAA